MSLILKNPLTTHDRMNTDLENRKRKRKEKKPFPISAAIFLSRRIFSVRHSISVTNKRSFGNPSRGPGWLLRCHVCHLFLGEFVFALDIRNSRRYQYPAWKIELHCSPLVLVWKKEFIYDFQQRLFRIKYSFVYILFGKIVFIH